MPDWLRRLRIELAGGEPTPPHLPAFGLVPNASEAAAAQVRAAAGRHPGASERSAADTVALFMPWLHARLEGCLQRTFALELNLARLRGRLDGASPHDRYQDFVDGLRSRSAAAGLLGAYPVLGRVLIEEVDRWSESSNELLQRLAEDRPVIQAELGRATELGPVTGVEFGRGDPHAGGRSVAIVHFAGGTTVVYKPKPMATDRHFAGLLAWLNDRGAPLAFASAAVVDRGAHGWMEHLVHQPCVTRVDVHRFYRRMGGLLAILHILQAGDLHAENVIARGADPILLDTEVLFHPRGRMMEPAPPDAELDRHWNASVLRTGLLPSPGPPQADGRGRDASGIAGFTDDSGGWPVPSWMGGETDELRLGVGISDAVASHHRPHDHRGAVDPGLYRSDVLEGFDELYDLLRAQRARLAAVDGPLQAFADDAVRVVLRPTYAYDALLRSSLHPDLLRDAVDRDAFLDHLWQGIALEPERIAALSSERRQLEGQDIPRFTTRPGASWIVGDDGTRVETFVAPEDVVDVETGVHQLGDRDFERQRWLVGAAFAGLRSETAHEPGRAPAGAPSLWWTSRTGRGQASALELAAAVAVRLEALSVPSDFGTTWFGLEPTSEERWRVSPAGLDLYGGVPGIALFLAYLRSVTADPALEPLAASAVEVVLAKARHDDLENVSIGAFDGIGGLVYAMTHLGVLRGQEAILDEASGLCGRILEAAAEDRCNDIVSGAAGAICALLGLAAAHGSHAPLEAAIACGDGLIARSRSCPGGLGWTTLDVEEGILAGFAHGSAGIAHALARLGDASGNVRFREAALGAFAGESVLRAPGEDNWPDHRNGRVSRPGMYAWCHGAAGVALGRLDLPRPPPEVRADARIGLRSTARRGPIANHSLCHGALGNLEILDLAAAGHDDLRPANARMRSHVLEDLVARGPQCATPGNVETPGLMVGLAGIGLALLRLERPDAVPTVLRLDPPPGPGRFASSA